MWWVEILLSLSVLLLAWLASPVVRLWAARTGSSVDRPTAAAASLALALIWVQLGGMLLGFFHELRAPVVVSWIVLGAACSGWIGFRYVGFAKPNRLDADAAAAMIPLAGYLLLAVVPPWYRDSMVYHLALPRAFAVAGGYVRPDDNIFASFPLGWESIQAMLHALGSAPDYYAPFNPRLAAVWITGAGALATVGLGRVLGATSRASTAAGLLFLFVPTVVEFGSSAYVEAWLVLLSTLGLLCSIRVIRGEGQFLVPAACFAGSAASVKYPGLAVCGALVLLLAANGLRRGPAGSRRALSQALRFGLIAMAIGSPFYIRNLVERGNPVFPLAFELFGGQGWDEWRAWAYGVTLSNYGFERSIEGVLLLPLRLFAARNRLAGIEGSIGPVVGLGLVAAIWRASEREGRGRLAALAFALLWTIFWACSVQQARFYLVAVPGLLALLVSSFARSLERWGLVACAAISLLWCAPIYAELWREQATGSWLAGDISQDDLLNRLLPESYAIERELERLVPADGRVWLVWMRGYTYYLRRPFRLDSVFEAYRFEALLDHTASTQDVTEALHEDGITHLVINHRFFLQNDNADLTPGRTRRIADRFAALVKEGALRPILERGALVAYQVEDQSTERAHESGMTEGKE